MTNGRLIDSLARAVETSPDDVNLRLHLAELLLSASRPAEAMPHVSAVLELDPSSAHAQILMSEALTQTDPLGAHRPTSDATTFDWASAEADLEDGPPAVLTDGHHDVALDWPYGVAESRLRLRDFRGMPEVKNRLEAAFLAPMRNPELRRLHGRALRGGLLLYGPPGCGRTFLAQALAGEMGARFLGISMAEVVDKDVAQSEAVGDVFDLARRHAPCLLFLDDIDVLDDGRPMGRGPGQRGTVNRLLTEMDALRDARAEVFVLGATNRPWHVDEALNRPGRLDRRLLVLPPDQCAREAIFRHHLSERPVDGVDVRSLAQSTDGLSGADIAHVCDFAADRAQAKAASSGTITMADLESARTTVCPSPRSWFESAHGLARRANRDGMYDDLLAYIRDQRLV